MRSIRDFFAEEYSDGWFFGDLNITRSAIKLLPMLIWCAQNRKVMTYTDMARNVRIPHKLMRWPLFVRATGHLAGAIGEYCRDENIPPLNALVINKTTGMPGDGVAWTLEKHGVRNFAELNDDEKWEALNRYIYPLIFQPGIWAMMLKINDIDPIKPQYFQNFDENDADEEFNDPAPCSHTHESEESDAHKALKEYVMNNCAHIENLRLYGCETGNAELEYCFPSLDRADIFFKNDTYNIACEVKSYLSDEDDIKRGLFQCVKYKALLNAMNTLQGKETFSECILITQNELSDEIRMAAERLQIPHVLLSRKTVGN